MITVYSVIAGLSLATYEAVESKNGIANLSDVDFGETIARIDSWQHFPGVLLQPGEIEGYTVGDREFNSNVGTFRMNLILPVNDVYTLRFHSIEGVTRVFINGKSVEVIGDVSIYSRGAISKARGLEYVVFSQNRQIDVVVQYMDTNRLTLDENPLYIGFQRNMQTLMTRNYFYSFSIFGTLVAAFLIHMGLYFFHQHLNANLFFSLICLVLSVRYGLAGELLFNNLFPNITWQISYLVQHFTIVLLVVLSVGFIESFFQIRRHRWLRYLVFAISLVFSLSVFFLKPTNYATITYYYQFLFFAYLIYSIFRQLVRIRSMEQEQIVALVGVATFMIGFAYDIDTFTNTWRMLERIPVFSILMMMITVYIEVAALFLQFMKIENTLTAMRKVENNLAAENKLLQQLNELKTSFLASISHEIRTPLTVMSGYAQITKYSLPETMASGEIGTNLDLIMQEANRLSGMVSQLLLIASGQELNRNREEIQIDILISRAIQLLDPVAAARENTLRRKIQRDLPAVRVNADAIYQVLLNLIVNANRHSEKSTILITAQQKEAKVVVSVIDQGCGIGPEELERVFDRYYTVSESPDPNESSGLGLSICKAIVEEHGGVISIQSEVGVGTEVSFDLEANVNG